MVALEVWSSKVEELSLWVLENVVKQCAFEAWICVYLWIVCLSFLFMSIYVSGASHLPKVKMRSRSVQMLWSMSWKLEVSWRGLGGFLEVSRHNWCNVNSKCRNKISVLRQENRLAWNDWPKTNWNQKISSVPAASIKIRYGTYNSASDQDILFFYSMVPALEQRRLNWTSISPILNSNYIYTSRKWSSHLHHLYWHFPQVPLLYLQ